MKISSLYITCCLALILGTSAQLSKDDTNPVESYINNYLSIAQSEMQRVGIPASIKLAQGILESNSGRSTLALKANNHFGIKCGKYWTGQTHHREDDDYVNGKLIKSCFRKFSKPDISYIAHSDFLTNPGSQYRYGFLFDLDPTDYVSWARGLKSSGYATDPKYADKLISVIEKYELYKYDTSYGIPQPKDEIAQVKINTNPKGNADIQAPSEDRNSQRRKRSNIKLSIEDNIHIVREGENMEIIADKYNIDVDLFYFQNRIPKGREPQVGEKLKIEGYFHWGKKPSIQKQKKSKLQELLFEDESMTITIQ